MSSFWLYERQDDPITINDVLCEFEEAIDLYEIRVRIASEMLHHTMPGSHNNLFLINAINEANNRIQTLSRKIRRS